MASLAAPAGPERFLKASLTVPCAIAALIFALPKIPLAAEPAEKRLLIAERPPSIEPAVAPLTEPTTESTKPVASDALTPANPAPTAPKSVSPNV